MPVDLDQTLGAASLDLEVTAGPAAGLSLTLHEDFRVGSGEKGPASLGGDRWLSASHALFHRGPDGWAVEDLRSLEGTKVNGRAITGAATLSPGDVVEIGSSRIAVGADGASPPPAGPGGRVPAPAAESRRDLDGKRVIATLLDTLVLLLPLAYIAVGFGHNRLPFWIASMAAALTYYFVCESLTGQTLGKKITGLRVVRVDGRPLTPSAVAARTVLRLVDQQIACLVGMITMILSGGRRQRLGDLAGRTAVARASRPAPRPERRGRERLAFWAYPLLWVAPAIGLFVIVPETRLLPCSDKVLAVGGEEGSCLTPDGRAWDVVNTGHTLHVPGYSARLVGTKVKEMQAGRLRIAGVRPDTPVDVVGFRVAVRNDGRRPLRFDLAEPSVALAVELADGRPDVLPHLARHRRTGLRTFADAGPIAPGRTRVAWVQFVMPPMAVTRLRDPGFGVAFYPAPGTGGVVHVGEIRLSRAATPAGARALAGLAG